MIVKPIQSPTHQPSWNQETPSATEGGIQQQPMGCISRHVAAIFIHQ